jgi:hypothetical protein
MNANLLIDAIVRQTTILIAHLATATGVRSPLAHMANQIFADLIRELKDQGLGNRVIADMFGLSLRTYHNKVRRMSESSTERGKTLWEAIWVYVQQKETVLRSDVERRFSRDDEIVVRGVLKDLVESGILYQSGVGQGLTYRVANPDEVGKTTVSDSEVESDLLLVAINRYRPINLEQLSEIVPLSKDKLQRALKKLLAEGKIQVRDRQGKVFYECDECLIPVNASSGWEAAILDHYQAMVTAICTKLRKGQTRAKQGELIGGSTYSYEVWDEHPMQDEVLGFLESTRKRAQRLRERVKSYNKKHTVDKKTRKRVFTYVGQTIIEPEERSEE